MSFQWLQMRITEEKERREREAVIMERLPRGLQELHGSLSTCIDAYTSAFGSQSADAKMAGNRIRITVREEQAGRWQERGHVEVSSVLTLPGFQVERGAGDPLLIEVGVLPGDKIFYRDRELDQYLTMEELTRRILDRVFFPKLKE